LLAPRKENDKQNEKHKRNKYKEINVEIQKTVLKFKTQNKEILKKRV
jgi:hypothetical protein